MNIGEYYGREPVTPYAYKIKTPATVPLPEWIVGVELEIEGVSNTVRLQYPGVTFTEDGSLRNGLDGETRGIEAITKPITIASVDHALTGLLQKYGITGANYSDRCSTHVHFNVNPLTWEQLAGVCLVYQTVERLLFGYVANERENNIFCVPWYQCNLSYKVVNLIKTDATTAIRRWQKYTALNLLPVDTQGSIEFRHLEGTCDVKRIVNWISLLAKVFEYAINTPIDVIEQEILMMNTVSNYREWMNKVFNEWVGLFDGDIIETSLAQGVIDSKLMLSQSIPVEVSADSAWRALLARELEHVRGLATVDRVYTIAGDPIFTPIPEERNTP